MCLYLWLRAAVIYINRSARSLADVRGGNVLQKSGYFEWLALGGGCFCITSY